MHLVCIYTEREEIDFLCIYTQTEKMYFLCLYMNTRRGNAVLFYTCTHIQKMYLLYIWDFGIHIDEMEYIQRKWNSSIFTHMYRKGIPFIYAHIYRKYISSIYTHICRKCFCSTHEISGIPTRYIWHFFLSKMFHHFVKRKLCVAVCCSVLYCVAAWQVCCSMTSVLQHDKCVATW